MPRVLKFALPYEAGFIYVRHPNVPEQIRFDRDSKWFSKESMIKNEKDEDAFDGHLRAINALPACAPFIDRIESDRFKTWDEILDDPVNTTVCSEIVLMLARKRLTEDEKKLLVQPPST